MERRRRGLCGAKRSGPEPSLRLMAGRRFWRVERKLMGKW